MGIFLYLPTVITGSVKRKLKKVTHVIYCSGLQKYIFSSTYSGYSIRAWYILPSIFLKIFFISLMSFSVIGEFTNWFCSIWCSIIESTRLLMDSGSACFRLLLAASTESAIINTAVSFENGKGPGYLKMSSSGTFSGKFFR